MNDFSFTSEYVMTLEFEDIARPQETQFVEDDNVQQNEEFEVFDEMCVPGENGNVDLDYKIRAVEFWRSGKKERKSIGNVQHSFRKVKSVAQLYSWEAN